MFLSKFNHMRRSYNFKSEDREAKKEIIMKKLREPVCFPLKHNNTVEIRKDHDKNHLTIDNIATFEVTPDKRQMLVRNFWEAGDVYFHEDTFIFMTKRELAKLMYLLSDLYDVMDNG